MMPNVTKDFMTTIAKTSVTMRVHMATQSITLNTIK